MREGSSYGNAFPNSPQNRGTNIHYPTSSQYDGSPNRHDVNNRQVINAQHPRPHYQKIYSNQRQVSKSPNTQLLDSGQGAQSALCSPIVLAVIALLAIIGIALTLIFGLSDISGPNMPLQMKELESSNKNSIQNGKSSEKGNTNEGQKSTAQIKSHKFHIYSHKLPNQLLKNQQHKKNVQQHMQLHVGLRSMV